MDKLSCKDISGLRFKNAKMFLWIKLCKSFMRNFQIVLKILKFFVQMSELYFLYPFIKCIKITWENSWKNSSKSYLDLFFFSVFCLQTIGLNQFWKGKLISHWGAYYVVLRKPKWSRSHALESNLFHFIVQS